MARKYTKTSEYWEKRKKKKEDALRSHARQSDYQPEMIGEGLMGSESNELISFASRLSDSTDRSFTRKNTVTSNAISNRFVNIENGLLPCEFSKDHVSAGDAIVLAQKAYFNVPVVKSTIDIMSEFANSDLYLKGGTAKSKSFVDTWLKKVNIEKLKEQFFLEFYRSGNIFFWRADATLTEQGVKSTIRKFNVSKAANVALPVKYTLLNPVQILAHDALYFDDNVYVKILSDYELLKLRNPKTDDEKELFNSLPKEVQALIQNRGVSSTNNLVYINLDPELLHAAFYKKQDYEPLAVPMCFAVLDDINKKMELKKVDQAIARSIEQVVLLVTMGTEPEKGGVNAKNIAAMQDIFRNSSVGRVLVADYTTKAEFIIPDMKKVLGKEKYEVLNTDIREGLQNIMLGDSKYADAQLKLRVFFQRLDEARMVFLRDFLQPEINRVCGLFDLRNPPKAHFAELDTMDNQSLQKLVIRMVELGVLTPEQGMDVIHTGVFPVSEDLDEAQEKYKEQRDDGKFVPIMSNISEQQVQQQREQFEEQLDQDDRHHEEDIKRDIEVQKQQKATQRAQVSKQKQAGGRPIGTSKATFSVQSITETIKEFDKFFVDAEKLYKKELNIKRLSKEKKENLSDLCSQIMVAKNIDQWTETLISICHDQSKVLGLNPLEKVTNISEEHVLDIYSSAILYHSQQKQV